MSVRRSSSAGRSVRFEAGWRGARPPAGAVDPARVTAPAALAGVGWFSATSPAEAAVPAALGDSNRRGRPPGDVGPNRRRGCLRPRSRHDGGCLKSPGAVAVQDGSRPVALGRRDRHRIGLGDGSTIRRPTRLRPQAEHGPQSPSPKDAGDQPEQAGRASSTRAANVRARNPWLKLSVIVTIQGTVVDDQGKPVADAQVVFFAPPPPEAKVDPVEVRAETNAQGQFGLSYPPLGRAAMGGVSCLDL